MAKREYDLISNSLDILGNYSDSADNLPKTVINKTPKAAVTQKSPFNRSMDAIQKQNEGFFTLGKLCSAIIYFLEKCYSADFPTKIEMPTSRLMRTKEMPDITDVDDSEEY